MSITINDLPDLKRLLIEHPEWRAEIRQLVLTDELVELPRVFAETRSRYEARFERIERALEQLILRVDQLAIRVDELAQAQARTEATLQRLIERMDKFEIRQGNMLGTLLEIKYRERAGSYFGRYLRKIRVIPLGTVHDTLEEVVSTHLSADEEAELSALDLVIAGRLKQAHSSADANTEIYLAVEISAVIDRIDVQRAQTRAQLLRKAGLITVPVVAGDGLTTGASELLNQTRMLVLLDGRHEGWERALDAALKN